MRLLPMTLACTLAFLAVSNGWAQSADGTTTVPMKVPSGTLSPGASSSDASALMTIPGSGGTNQPQYQTFIDPSCEGIANRTQFEVTVEALLLKLDRPRQQDLLLQTGTNAVLLRMGDLDFGLQVGPRITVGYTGTPEEGSSFEISYFGIYDWSAEQRVFGSNNLRLPGALGTPLLISTPPFILFNDYTDSNAMRFYYQSKINSVEANLLYREQPWNISFLSGLRFIKFEEFFGITSAEVSGFPSVYEVDAGNDMFGGQIGARYREQFNCWEVSAWTKFGVYANTATQHQFLTDNENLNVLRNNGEGHTRTAFAADLNFTLGYHIRQNVILRAGYNVMWLGGVARAPGQLDFSYNSASGTGINYGNAFIHGANVGFEARW